MKKAALHNLGCKVNAYETEAMQQILENAGYEIVPPCKKDESGCHCSGSRLLCADKRGTGIGG